jgi:hypothetical protein
MTFSLASVNVDGIQVSAQREYTTGVVLQSFEENMQIIKDFMASKSPPPADYDYTALKKAIENLRDLSVNGIDCPLDASNPNGDHKIYYLTMQMNESLDLLFKSLNAVGVTINKTDPIDISSNPTWYQKWYDLGAATPLLQNVFVTALHAKENSRSLQAMVELQYIKRANDLMGEKMKDLQKALTLTKDSLALLTDLQNLHNQIQVQNRPPFSAFLDIYKTNPSLFQGLYGSAASAYFGIPLTPSLVNDGWQIPPTLGFLNYISTVDKSTTFRKKGNTYTITFTSEINKLIPEGFLEKYGLKEQSVNAKGEHIYTTTDNLIEKDERFLAGGFRQYYRIQYVSAIGPGASFQGTTLQNMTLQSFGGGGTSYLSDMLSGRYGLSRSPELLKEVQNLVKYRSTITAQIAALHAENPPAPGKEVDPNSLEGRLTSVLNDINRVFVTADKKPITSGTPLAEAYEGFKAWMMDQYDGNSSKSGEFQQNITNAITAGQALNDTQKESVRQFLFIFEEFYKSGSAVLQTLEQITSRMAQAIGRG